MLLACYTVAALRPRLVPAGAVVTGLVLLHSALVTSGVSAFAAVAQAVLVPAVVCVLGRLAGRLDESNRRLAEATEQLRREQEQRTREAVAEERLRIARELHDVVAHNMSVISVHAGLAGYVFDDDPGTARAAIGTIGEIGRETLVELRRLLDLLRTGEAQEDEGPVPTLDALPALVSAVSAAGVTARLGVGADVPALPSGLQLAVYRVVQEALTNVIKHAGPCRVGVVVRRRGDVLEVEVVDDGRGPAGGGGGHGLLGMRERARLYGGVLTAGPGEGGGFAVRLAVPLP
jgi:signal transduction histidine kinase